MEAVKEEITESHISALRNQFPALRVKVNNRPLVYFDNAATTQKPESVIQSISHYYKNYNANIHRGIHHLAEEATAAYEHTRNEVKNFLNAQHREEILFTKGTTDSINLVASSWGRANLNENDEVIITTMEHHSNIVPWQMICNEKRAKLKVIPISDEGELDLDAYRSMLSSKTKMVSIVHVSNALGTVNPIAEMIQMAHDHGAVVLIDGAQSTPHVRIDVTELGCDFFALSAHKLYGPTGVGVLYGRKELLEAMPPYQGGGEMIAEVTFEKTTYNELPYKFEAGTPNIADVIALRDAIEFIQSVNGQWVHQHETELLNYCTERLSIIEGIRIIGTAKHKIGVVSFVLDGAHPQDLGVLLDQQGVAVRTGHHCTEPLMRRYHIPGTVRASFAMYNTKDEIDVLVEALIKAKKMLL